jgi:glycosyltransferase involved in cell wall biosynthesis
VTYVEEQPFAVREAGSGPDMSVAICAYTLLRWDGLLAAVESVLAQLLPGDEVLVVVDHNDELLARAADRFAGPCAVRVVANAGPRGLSGARNTAIDASRGALIAFLDDDAVAGTGWLERMRAALGDDDVLAVGTAALPAWPAGRRPGWFPPEFDWVVGCSYLGLPSVPSDVRNVIGAGMAFRREAFEFAGRFSTAVGRTGTAGTGCEETELCIRLRGARPGARVAYLPDVAVSHLVTPDRLRLRYFLRRCYGEGLSKARVARLVGADAGLSTERRYITAVLPRGVLRELRRGLRGQWAGLAAAALIVSGVLVTGAAYAGGRLLGRGAP